MLNFTRYLACIVASFLAAGISSRARAEAIEPASQQTASVAAPVTANSEADTDDDASADDAEESGGIDPESEAVSTGNEVTDETLRYTTEISDAELGRRFCANLESLGSISVGFAESGRVIGAVKMGHDQAWDVIVPDYAWGTQETIDYLSDAARAVKEEFPESAPLRINHIGKKEGGYVRPHKTHQSGRDADLGFYYRGDVGPGGLSKKREQAIDPARNWALVRALVSQADVQVILVDRRIQTVLYDQALALGEDKAWLDTLFNAGSASVLQHAKHHRDHFHVRFYSPRAQELGRRVQPILAKRPDENRISHRIRSGDTLGHIARKYGSTVAMIQRANGMRNSFLSLGRSLTVPMRGPCTQCPMPPPIVVPPRRVPPAFKTAALVPSSENSVTTASASH